MPDNPAPPTKLQPGSIWRKWDLHIHSPLSGLSNQFVWLQSDAPDWEAYLGALEALCDVAVIGITDYFSIAGYKQVLGYKRDGRLPNIARILPNVELRLDTFVVDQKARDINFHVIFSDELHPEDIDKEFLEASPTPSNRRMQSNPAKEPTKAVDSVATDHSRKPAA